MPIKVPSEQQALPSTVNMTLANASLANASLANAEFANAELTSTANDIGNDADIISAYLKSLRRQPIQPEIHRALGALYARQQKHSRAICHYQMALLQRPGWSEAAWPLGKLFYRLGCYDQALATYQKILEYTPSCAKTCFAIGVLLEQSGKLGLAIKSYRQAALLNPQYSDAYCYWGSALACLKEYEAAASVYKHAIELMPMDAALHGRLGQVMLVQGDSAGAIAAYNTSLSLNDNFAETYQNLGRLWRRYQDLAKAEDYFRQALKLEPENVSMLNDYASVLLSRGNWADLFDCFRMAIAQQPDWIEAYCKKAMRISGPKAGPETGSGTGSGTGPKKDKDLLQQLQQTSARFLLGLQQAKSATTVAILQERLGQAYSQLGKLSMACDAPSHAEQCYRSALALMPDELAIYRDLGHCLMVQGRRTAAIAIYQAGILQSEQVGKHLSPDNAWVAEGAKQQPMTVEILRSQLQQALVIEPTLKNSEIAGFYHHAHDWLADNGLSPSGKCSGKCSSVECSSQHSQKHSKKHSQKHLDRSEIPSKATRDPACGGVTCQSCMGRLVRQFSPVRVGKRTYHCQPDTPDGGWPFPTFTVTIPQGRAWIAPQTSAWDVCNEIAIFTPDNFLLGDLSRAFPWYLPGCQRHDDIASHPVLQRLTPLPAVQHIPGKVAVLSALSGHIYYHWLFDLLPRIGVLQQDLHRQGLDLDHIDYFVVNSIEKDFQRETLAALGIPLEKVIASDRSPHFQAEQLIVPSFPGHLDWVPPGSMDFLRKAFLSAQSTERGEGTTHRRPGKRFYITREQANYRHVFNETAVIEMLSRFGFVTVALETLTVAEQIELFSEAEVIVAAHGSGLANLVFCRPETVVIECFSPNYVRTDYWMISQYLKLDHYYLIGEGLTCYPLRQILYPSGLTEDFSIDVTALRLLLKTAGITPEQTSFAQSRFGQV